MQRSAIVLVAALLSGGPVRADDRTAHVTGDPAYGEWLAAECLTCHQASGTDQGIPVITGWAPQSFVEIMNAYRYGARQHGVMNAVARSLGDAEIASLAVYFAALEAAN